MRASILLRATLGTLVAVAALTLGTSARAAAPTADTPSRADALFREGTELLDHGHVGEACDALAQSFALDAELGTLLNLGLCHERQGKKAAAWRELEDAGAWAAAAGQSDRRDYAHQHAAALERSLVRVEVHVDPHAHVAVKLDGDVVPATGNIAATFVDPGRHILEATAPSREPFTTTFDVADPGAAARDGAPPRVILVPDLAMADGVVAPSSPAPSSNVLAEKPSSAAPGRVAGLALAGVGVAGLGVGLVAGAFAISDLDSGSAAHAKTAELVSMAGFGTSVAALGVGTWLYLSAPSSKTARVGVAPIVSQRTAGVGVGGTF